MASGHVNRTNRPNTWLHRPACGVKKVLANPEPSTHGTKHHSASGRQFGGFRTEADIGPDFMSTQPSFLEGRHAICSRRRAV
jgi:hypothetical protein